MKPPVDSWERAEGQTGDVTLKLKDGSTVVLDECVTSYKRWPHRLSDDDLKKLTERHDAAEGLQKEKT